MFVTWSTVLVWSCNKIWKWKTSWKIDTHGDFWFASWSYLLVCWQSAPWLEDGRIDIDFLMKCWKLITELTCMIMNPIFPWLGLHSDDNFNITSAVMLCSFWIRICWSWWEHSCCLVTLRVFGSTTHVTRVSSDNVNIAAEHQEPAEVLFQLGNTNTPQILGSKIIISVAASGVLVAASGVVCDGSLFSLEIAVSTKLLTSDRARAKTSVSLINQFALVGQHHEAVGLQGRVVDVAHIGQAHPCHKSLTAK